MDSKAVSKVSSMRRAPTPRWPLLSALVVASIAAIAVALWLYQIDQGGRRAEAAAAKSNYTNHQADCERLVPPGPMVVSCLIEFRKTAHEQKHAEAELQAQQDTSAWSFALMWVGVLSTLISGVGIVLVYQNLVATREIGQNQTRAYITVEDLLAPLQGPDCFSFAIWNTGATPARGMRWTYMLAKFYDQKKGVAKMIRPVPNDNTAAQMAGGARDHRVRIFADQKHADWVRGGLAQIAEGESVEFVILIQFKDVFGRRFELEEKVIIAGGRTLGSDSVNIVAVDSSEREISEAEYNEGPYIPPLPGENKYR